MCAKPYICRIVESILQQNKNNVHVVHLFPWKFVSLQSILIKEINYWGNQAACIYDSEGLD